MSATREGRSPPGAGDVDGLAGGRKERELIDGPAGEDPGVLGTAAALHGDDEGVGRSGESGECAGHDGVGAMAVPVSIAVAIFGIDSGGEVGAHHDVAGFDFLADEDGGGGERDLVFGDEIGGRGEDAGRISESRSRLRASPKTGSLLPWEKVGLMTM